MKLAAHHEHHFEPERVSEWENEGHHSSTTWAQCRCGLRRRERRFRGSLYEVRFQVEVAGPWLDPVPLLAARLPVRLCSCVEREGPLGCPLCGELGVLDPDGARIPLDQEQPMSELGDRILLLELSGTSVLMPVALRSLLADALAAGEAMAAQADTPAAEEWREAADRIRAITPDPEEQING